MMFIFKTHRLSIVAVSTIVLYIKTIVHRIIALRWHSFIKNGISLISGRRYSDNFREKNPVVAEVVEETPATEVVEETPEVQVEEAAPAAEAPASNLITIKSPMIGTFYRKPSPDKPLFIEVGDEVTPGKVVCIIEAMKLLNEIESEFAGVVKEILCENGQGVEFDQPLFIIA